MEKKKSKINYIFVLYILVSLTYIFCSSREIFSPFITNFVFMIFTVVTTAYLFSEWKKSLSLFDFICFIFSLIPAFYMISYVIKTLIKL